MLPSQEGAGCGLREPKSQGTMRRREMEQLVSNRRDFRSTASGGWRDRTRGAGQSSATKLLESRQLGEDQGRQLL